MEERRAAAIAASEAEQAVTGASAARPANMVRAVRQSVTRSSAPEAASPPAADPAPAAPVRSEPVNDPAPVPVAVEKDMVAPATAPAANPASTDPALLWALGGGVLLLLGLAGTAMIRRRRRQEDAAFFENERRMAYGDAPVTPVVLSAPVAQDSAPMPVAPVAGRVGEDATIAQMVAAAPDARNPFRTHARRLRRARFLMAQRDAASVTRPAPQTTHAEPVATPAMDRSQTVYRFDGQRPRPGFLKPRTN